MARVVNGYFQPSDMERKLSERKKRVLKAMPALAAASAGLLSFVRMNSDLRGALLGVLIGVSLVAIVKMQKLRRC